MTTVSLPYSPLGLMEIFHSPFGLYPMETQTVKLQKALPNMVWQVMPMLVVVPKLSQGEKDLGDPPNNIRITHHTHKLAVLL